MSYKFPVLLRENFELNFMELIFALWYYVFIFKMHIVLIPAVSNVHTSLIKK